MSFFEPTSRVMDVIEQVAFRFEQFVRYVAATLGFLAVLVGIGYASVKAPVVGAIVIGVVVLVLCVYLINRYGLLSANEDEDGIPFHLRIGEYGAIKDDDWEGSALEWTLPNGADTENDRRTAEINLALDIERDQDRRRQAA
jgi:hypothetical protein